MRELESSAVPGGLRDRLFVYRIDLNAGNSCGVRASTPCSPRGSAKTGIDPRADYRKAGWLGIALVPPATRGMP
jgi:hypothetical protein